MASFLSFDLSCVAASFCSCIPAFQLHNVPVFQMQQISFPTALALYSLFSDCGLVFTSAIIYCCSRLPLSCSSCVPPAVIFRSFCYCGSVSVFQLWQLVAVFQLFSWYNLSFSPLWQCSCLPSLATFPSFSFGWYADFQIRHFYSILAALTFQSLNYDRSLVFQLLQPIRCGRCQSFGFGSFPISQSWQASTCQPILN